MTIALMPYPKIRFFTNSGTFAPLSGGKVYTYEPGTTTPKATYTDSTGSATNTNPVILDSAGEASIWLSGFYKIIVKDANDVTHWTQDNVSGAAAEVTGSTQTIEWLSYAHTFAYVSATQFSTTGDTRAIYEVGRRVKCIVGAGTVYGTITANAYTTVTTVTVSLDTGTLDSGLSDVDVGILTTTNPSIPSLYTAPPRLTTTQRNAYTAAAGMVIYNTTTARFEVYRAGAWHALVENDTTDTLTNKTLTTPTIVDFTNAQHDHGDADSGGPISAVGIADGAITPAKLSIMGAYAVGEYAVCLAPTERIIAATAYTKIKEMKVVGLSGTLRIKYDFRTEGATVPYSRVYRNGVAVGAEHTSGSSTWTTFSEDIAGWNSGDLIQVYIKEYAGGANIGVRNLGVFGTLPLVGGQTNGY